MSFVSFLNLYFQTKGNNFVNRCNIVTESSEQFDLAGLILTGCF